MSATVLGHPAPSGDYREFRFDARNSCTWILFQPPTEEDWVGVFGAGDYGGNAVAVDWSANRALVVAGGRGYLLDTKGRALIRLLPQESLQDVAWASHSGGVWVVADDLRLFVLDADGARLWSTRRVSWDGIRRLRVSGDLVHGEAQTGAGAYDKDYWSPFTVDLGTRAVQGDIYSGPQIEFAD